MTPQHPTRTNLLRKAGHSIRRSPSTRLEKSESNQIYEFSKQTSNKKKLNRPETGLGKERGMASYHEVEARGCSSLHWLLKTASVFRLMTSRGIPKAGGNRNANTKRGKLKDE